MKGKLHVTRSSQLAEVLIAGQSITLFDRKIRAPLCILDRLSLGGWRDEPQIVAHRWQTAASGGWWHEAVYRTLRAAREAYTQVAAHPAAMDVGEYNRRRAGGRQ